MSQQDLFDITLTRDELIMLAALAVRPMSSTTATKPEYASLHTKLANALGRI